MIYFVILTTVLHVIGVMNDAKGGAKTDKVAAALGAALVTWGVVLITLHYAK